MENGTSPSLQASDPVAAGQAASRKTDPLAGGGEMGALMRSIDWSRTAVGPVSEWPQSLRTALSILLETGFPMYIAWGPEFTQFYNDGFRPILGSTKHPAALGLSTRITFAEIWDIIGPMFQGVLQGTPTTLVDFQLGLDRHGFVEECYFIFSYSPIREESGGVGGVLVTVMESTERVLGARRLKTLQELAARTQKAATAEAACEVAATVLGENPDDLPFGLLYLLAPDGRQATLAGAAGIAPGAAASPVAIDLTAADPVWPVAAVVATGATRILEEPSALAGPLAVQRVAVIPIAQPGEGRPAGVLVAALSPRLLPDEKYRGFLELVAGQVATAIANARALAEAQARAEALAEIDRAKTAFFSNVSHELRTPLTLILGPAQDALDALDALDHGAAALPAAERERWELVHRNALRLLKLVNTLLEFSRLEAGRIEASYEPTDLAALTRDLASTFGSAVERAGLRFELDLETLGEPVFVDPEMWEKVVLNLLSNALKFTFTGEIAVALHRRGDEAVLTVRDTGIGIPAEQLPRLFDRFHRVPDARSRTHEGTGIGLALVQELVKLHGGTVTVASAVDRGTTFTVALPLGAAHLPEDRIAAPRGLSSTAAGAAPFVAEALRWSPAGAAAAPAPQGKGAARILLADDNADMRDYVTRLLGERFAVEAVADGLAALERAREAPPDLILSDVMMPGLDGLQLLQALRADERTRDVPVIFLSARAGEEASLEGLSAGADDYLIKPFSARELLARVGTRLEISQLRSEAEATRARLDSQFLLREREARAEAEVANRAKDEFLAMLGHELRNPLAPIVTALQLMRLRGDEMLKKERTVIERQVDHLIRLVDDLLDISRITRGKVELRRARIELSEIVAKAIEMAGPLIEQRQHNLTVDVPRLGLAVEADAVRMAQVVSNLLNNAAKYTEPHGSIAVHAAAAGDAVVLRVRDTGIGLSAEMLPRVFELFAQESQALDRAQGGLGLGLAIVRSLVELHGGTVEARSEGLGRGSELVVRLPAAQAGDPPAPAGAPREEPEIAARPGALRILVVDDNADAAELMATTLQMMGHSTHVAPDGPAALAIAGSFQPDVALVDIGLPVMDGYELAHHLRELPGLASLRLIAVTGYSQEEDRRQAEAAGFERFLVKPIQIQELRGLLASTR
ncbi:MAG TPA: ATP-binding protein [Thermoanaerobaculia bacterium]|jgi:signal transduction histidine kinase|nr:ATP-binding protein [Thermoanaerobaculia bacterium]